MSRKKISQKIETELLINCRRRCCICFGLNQDHRIKQGQIAHLDQNRDNNKSQNLAFLCLAHHDQYDSRSSQSKGLTKNEVSHFKEELENYIKTNFINPIEKENKELKVDIYSGEYNRGSEFESSELKITYLGNNLIHVKGISFWGITREYGPNIGELDFVTEVNINKAIYSDNHFDEKYKIELEFLGGKLKVKENLVIGYFGMNVAFGGEYFRCR